MTAVTDQDHTEHTDQHGATGRRRHSQTDAMSQTRVRSATGHAVGDARGQTARRRRQASPRVQAPRVQDEPMPPSVGAMGMRQGRDAREGRRPRGEATREPGRRPRRGSRRGAAPASPPAARSRTAEPVGPGRTRFGPEAAPGTTGSSRAGSTRQPHAQTGSPMTDTRRRPAARHAARLRRAAALPARRAARARRALPHPARQQDPRRGRPGPRRGGGAAQALRAAHRRRHRGRHRQRQVAAVQRARRGDHLGDGRTPADHRRAHRVQLERRRRQPHRPARHPGPAAPPAAADRGGRGAAARAGPDRPARPRLGGRPAPRAGGPRPGARRRGHLGRRPGEVRRRRPPRALSAADGGARRGHVRRPQPDRPAARRGRRPGPRRPAAAARRGRHRARRVRRTGRDRARAVRAHRRRRRRTARGARPVRRGARGAAARRIAADVDAAAARLRPVYATGRRTGLSEEAREEFSDRLADAVGATAAGEAAERAWLRNANRACGTPWLRLWRWYQDRGEPADGPAARARRRPDEEATARQRVEQAVRTVADRASAGLPAPWAQAVREAAVRGVAGAAGGAGRAGARGPGCRRGGRRGRAGGRWPCWPRRP